MISYKSQCNYIHTSKPPLPSWQTVRLFAILNVTPCTPAGHGVFITLLPRWPIYLSPRDATAQQPQIFAFYQLLVPPPLAASVHFCRLCFQSCHPWKLHIDLWQVLHWWIREKCDFFMAVLECYPCLIHIRVLALLGFFLYYCTLTFSHHNSVLSLWLLLVCWCNYQIKFSLYATGI